MAASPPRYTRCPKCGQQPLPSEQRLPAACPHCGVILAKVGQVPPRKTPVAEPDLPHDAPTWTERLTPLPQPVVLLALGWEAWLLRRQSPRVAGRRTRKNGSL